MKLPQVKVALFSRIRKIEDNGGNYTLGQTDVLTCSKLGAPKTERKKTTLEILLSSLDSRTFMPRILGLAGSVEGEVV